MRIAATTPIAARLVALLLLPACGGALAADDHVVVDGVLDEPVWAHAQRFADFVSVQPLSGAPAPHDHRAEALLLPTPRGLAVGIRAWHPPGVPETRARMQRDGGEQVDRMNFMVDFNADGRTGYGFTVTTEGDIIDEVITNENAFDSDWDGDWQHAVARFDGGYSAEWLIPWSIAPMSGSASEVRTIAVYFDRVIAATGERFAWPDASFSRPRFVSDFAPVEVRQFRQQLFAVTPYGVALHDAVDGDTLFKSGVDVFWKPSGDHQFALTVNPDFGHVESDELVVNFSGTETFFSDRRPFFTENHSAFAVSHPLAELFYTRRVGAAADDGSGAADIDLAAKANGSVGAFGYGVFAASESGEAGRDFSLLRATHTAPTLGVGLTRTLTERPFLDREAAVTAIDATWRPNPRWQLRPLLVRSDVEHAGAQVRGRGAGLVTDWNPPGPWRQKYFAMWSDPHLQLNELGYQQRNDFRHLEWETGYRQDHLPASSAYASHSWEFELVHRETTDGLRLRQNATLLRSSRRRDGSSDYVLARWRQPAYDDIVSRGNGAVRTAGGPALYVERNRPRPGDGRFGWSWMLDVFPNTVSGHTVIVGGRPRLHLGSRFDIAIGLYHWRQSDWLLWQQGREFGSFESRRLQLDSDINWFIDERHELRMKLQAIAIDAQALQARRLLPDGRFADSDAPLDDFRLRTLGFQLRYRYKLGRLSNLYAVYSRGGLAIDDAGGGLGNALSDALSLRDDDQLMLKLSYRFEPFR